MSEVQYTKEAWDKGYSLLIDAQQKKTSDAYLHLFWMQHDKQAKISDSQLKKALQEYYDLKIQEILAECDKDEPDWFKIDNSVPQMSMMEGLTDDSGAKKIARLTVEHLDVLATRMRNMRVDFLNKEREQRLNPQNEQADAQTRQAQPQDGADTTVIDEHGAAKDKNIKQKMFRAQLKVLVKHFAAKKFSEQDEPLSIKDRGNYLYYGIDRI